MKARASTDLLGADISSWQTITNPQHFSTDFQFVYIRAYGSDGNADTKFLDHVKLSKQYRVPSGGYYFARPTPGADITADAQAQAQKFIDKLQEAYGVGNYGDLVPMLDVEAYAADKYDPATIISESEMKENSLALTSLFETSTAAPDTFGVTAGNFDGAGISHGALQFNFKSGSLQPIWRDLINQHSDVVAAAITNANDLATFKDVVLNRTTTDQIAWGSSITDPSNNHKVIEPWNTYFKNLGTSQESIDRQIVAAQWYFDQGKKYFDQFGLWTRRGYALMFDIAVQSGSISQAKIDLINADFAAMTTAGKTPEQIETEKMTIIVNRKVEEVSSTWQASYRERKMSIANGSGWVYGGTLYMDTTKYNAILEAAYQQRVEGYPYAWGMTGTQLKDWILAFRTYFRANTKQRSVGIYTSRWFLTDATQMNMSSTDLQALAIMPLWLAEWNQTDGYQPATFGGWANYALWQYGVIADADTHGVSHGQNQLDHDSTQSLALIMPPKPVTGIKVTQKDNTTINVSFLEPSDSDYIGSDIYLNGVWKAWVGKGTTSKDLTVSNAIGSQITVHVVSQDNYQDTTWTNPSSITLVDMTIPVVVEEPDQTINFVGHVAGEMARKIMVNGLASTELVPSAFGAEWWDYPKITADDASNMSYTISPSNGANNGHKIQFMFQFEVDPGGTTQLGAVEKLVFRIDALLNQPFTLKFWDHVAGAWDAASTVTFNGAAAGYVTITSTNPNHIGADKRVYISMLSVNSVVDPAIALTSKNYNLDWLSAIRQTTGEIVSTATPLYTGGSSGLASYIGLNKASILNDINTSRATANVFLHLNGTVAGLARLGFHDLTAQPTVAGTTAPTIHTTAAQINLAVGWNVWDISTDMRANIATYPGIVVYANANEASAQAYGNTNDANEPYIEVKGDWQATSGVTLGADYAELLVYRAEPIPPTPPKPEPVQAPPPYLTYDPTDEDIENMLRAKSGSRLVRFRFDLLDMNENKIRELKNVISGEVAMNALNTIKRTARFTLKESEDEPIDFLTNRIQPFAEFKLPDKFVQNADGSRVLLEGPWYSFPLGVYLLSSPKRREEGNQVFRDVEAYDGIVILEEDKFIDRYTVRAGTRYVDAIIDILKSAGITKYNIGFSDKVLENDVEYEPGTEKSKPIGDFLTAINFTALYVDEYGYFTAQQYVSPSDREPDFQYNEDEFSVILNGVEEELDLYSVPNHWVAVYTTTDSTNQVSLISNYTNDSPDSPTSTVNRGRTIVDFRQVTEIADQASLDAYVQRIAFEASQIFGKVTFNTAIMPIHGFQNVLYLVNNTLGIEGKYSETSWKFSFEAGATMTHEVRQVITI